MPYSWPHPLPGPDDRLSDGSHHDEHVEVRAAVDATHDAAADALSTAQDAQDTADGAQSTAEAALPKVSPTATGPLVVQSSVHRQHLIVRRGATDVHLTALANGGEIALGSNPLLTFLASSISSQVPINLPAGTPAITQATRRAYVDAQVSTATQAAADAQDTADQALESGWQIVWEGDAHEDDGNAQIAAPNVGQFADWDQLRLAVLLVGGTSKPVGRALIEMGGLGGMTVASVNLDPDQQYSVTMEADRHLNGDWSARIHDVAPESALADGRAAAVTIGSWMNFSSPDISVTVWPTGGARYVSARLYGYRHQEA